MYTSGRTSALDWNAFIFRKLLHACTHGKCQVPPSDPLWRAFTYSGLGRHGVVMPLLWKHQPNLNNRTPFIGRERLILFIDTVAMVPRSDRNVSIGGSSIVAKYGLDSPMKIHQPLLIGTIT